LIEGKKEKKTCPKGHESFPKENKFAGEEIKNSTGIIGRAQTRRRKKATVERENRAKSVYLYGRRE